MGTLADLPGPPAWALALGQGLAAVKMEVAELRVIQSNAHHISTLQCQLTVHAERDAANAEQLATMNCQHAVMHAAHVDQMATMNHHLAESEAARGHLNAQHTANTEALRAMEVQIAKPFRAGARFHSECIAWIRTLGFVVNDVHAVNHSGDAFFTIPFGSTKLRVLVDFKNYGTLSGVNELAAKAVLDAANVNDVGVQAVIDAAIAAASKVVRDDAQDLIAVNDVDAKFMLDAAPKTVLDDAQDIAATFTVVLDDAQDLIAVNDFDAQVVLDAANKVVLDDAHDVVLDAANKVVLCAATNVVHDNNGIDAVMLLYPNGSIPTNSTFASNLSWASHLMSSKKIGKGGADASLRSDRMFVCTQSTFLQGLLQLVTSRAQADAPMDQHRQDMFVRLTSLLGMLPATKMGELLALSAAVTKDHQAANYDKVMHMQKAWEAAGPGTPVAEAEPLWGVVDAITDMKVELGVLRAAFLSAPGGMCAAIDNCATMGGERGAAEEFWRSAKCAAPEVRAKIGNGHAAFHSTPGVLGAAICNCATMGGGRDFAESGANYEESPLNKPAKRPRGY